MLQAVLLLRQELADGDSVMDGAGEHTHDALVRFVGLLGLGYRYRFHIFIAVLPVPLSAEPLHLILVVPSCVSGQSKPATSGRN